MFNMSLLSHSMTTVYYKVVTSFFSLRCLTMNSPLTQFKQFHLLCADGSSRDFALCSRMLYAADMFCHGYLASLHLLSPRMTASVVVLQKHCYI